MEEKRAAKALALVQVGELFSAMQAFEGADLALGSDATLQELRNPVRRPNVAKIFALWCHQSLSWMKTSFCERGGHPNAVQRRDFQRPGQAATAPFQFALFTRAGCECVAHALQGLTETDPEATVLSIDGISAFDLVSRAAMLRGVSGVSGGQRAILFMRMFYGEPSVYLWEDDHGVVHNIHQAEGGEQGDALMPLHFALGQHAALVAVQSKFIPEEKLMAFLDDIYVVIRPERIGAVYVSLQNELLAHSGIRIHGGKTRVWNR